MDFSKWASHFRGLATDDNGSRAGQQPFEGKCPGCSGGRFVDAVCREQTFPGRRWEQQGLWQPQLHRGSYAMQIIATVSVNVRLITLKPNQKIPAADFFRSFLYAVYVFRSHIAFQLFKLAWTHNVDWIHVQVSGRQPGEPAVGESWKQVQPIPLMIPPSTSQNINSVGCFTSQEMWPSF